MLTRGSINPLYLYLTLLVISWVDAFWWLASGNLYSPASLTISPSGETGVASYFWNTITWQHLFLSIQQIPAPLRCLRAVIKDSEWILMSGFCTHWCSVSVTAQTMMYCCSDLPLICMLPDLFCDQDVWLSSLLLHWKSIMHWMPSCVRHRASLMQHAVTCPKPGMWLYQTRHETTQWICGDRGATP